MKTGASTRGEAAKGKSKQGQVANSKKCAKTEAYIVSCLPAVACLTLFGGFGEVMNTETGGLIAGLTNH